MGLFSRSKESAASASVLFDGIEVNYNPKVQEWMFFYRDNDFFADCPKFHMPTRDQLDSLLRDVESLRPQMIERLQQGWKDWGDVSINDGEEFTIHIENYVREETFDVNWSSGNSWGDMGITFSIKDNHIIKEEWGD